MAGMVWRAGHRVVLELVPVGRGEPEAEVDRDFPWVVPGAWTGPVPACGDSCHRVGEYSGYTWVHLPVRDCSAPLPKNAEAILAIFAARMAFSSRWTRSWLK